ncbi:hypothetical protein [Dyadobacter diqingensis]|uniref:hypothetical protein n=1 Tax=Dyadobacter diqingensis TaxID=2938121 RepID=UPI0020C18D6D|nr:hypothetical protein [Dyadobacter diqingensis]
MKHCCICILAILFFACKKTKIDPAPQFPSTLYLNGITKKSKIRLFTNKGEITDQSVIDKFVKTTKGFTKKDTSFTSGETLTFFSADSAEIPNSFNSLTVVKKENQLIFKSTNRRIITAANLESNYKMGRYQSEIEPVWDGKFSAYNMLVGYGDYSALKLSVFEYNRVSWFVQWNWGDTSSPDILTKSSSSGTMFNEFNESYISSIQKNDTLAIQEYFYSFQKK